MTPTPDHAALLKQLNQWHANGKHEKIEKTILALPEKERDFEVSGLLARALLNLHRYEDALRVLEPLRDQAQARGDAYWHYRVGSALYQLDGREAEAIPYLERAIELGDDYPQTYDLLLDAKKRAKQHWDTEPESKNAKTKISGKFIPKAFATITLNMRLRPAMRGWRYEDGLDFMLRSRGLGCVNGGGTQLSTDGEVEYCDIEIDLVDDSDETRRAVLSAVQKLDTAKGSKLKYRPALEGAAATEYPIGWMEGFAVYLDAENFTEEARQNKKFQEVYDALQDALSNNGALVASFWVGSDWKTALYFYGEGGVETMLEKANPILQTHPLCKKHRIVLLT